MNEPTDVPHAPRVRAAGDAAVLIEYGPSLDATIDPALVSRVQRLDAAIEAAGIAGVLECVPTFRSIALVLDPTVTTPGAVANEALALAAAVDAAGAHHATADATARRWRLPVHYGGDQGMDLEQIAARLDIATGELIDRHAGTEVSVHLLGFLPGFAFLGPTHPSLALPRRREPRTRVPPGTVAIANGLTAVYPWESPGGWHLIGHCPLPLFDPRRRRPTLFEAGDRARFEPIEAERLHALLHARDAGELVLEDFVDRDGDTP